ncbi:hypothetical protein ABI59_13595 [Acidobacteria bacterium Mor1]|nr:hypothetical protein ABI59_13595 [Acidobacteria bacterium Mor1]
MLTIALLIAVLVGGVVAVWGLTHDDVAEADLESVALAHQLNKVGLCANVLQALDEGNTAKARKLLEEGMSRSLSEAERLLDQDVSLDIATPNLREGVRRASEYNGDAGIADRADGVLDRLDGVVAAGAP